MIYVELFLQPQLMSHIDQSMLHCFSGLIYFTENSQCSTVSSTSTHITSKTRPMLFFTLQSDSVTHNDIIPSYMGRSEQGGYRLLLLPPGILLQILRRKTEWLNQDNARAS